MKEYNLTQAKKDEKLSDATFLKLIATSVVSILLCMVALCSTTWAWFSDSLPSNNNKISTAENCDLTVEVTDSNGAAVDISGSVVLSSTEAYTVTLTLPKDSASGYVIISSGGVEYRSPYIERHEEDTPKVISFELLTENASGLTVEFIPRWGIYADDSNVAAGGKLVIN